MKNGIDYIKHVRAKPGKKVAKEVQSIISVGGTAVLGLGSWFAGMLFGFEADIDWLPGNDINHDGEWNGENAYMLGYLIGFPTIGAAVSKGAGWLAKKGIEVYTSHKETTPQDREFFALHDSLVDLVKNDQYLSRGEFEGLPKTYKDALRIDKLTDYLNKGHVGSVEELMAKFEDYEARRFARQVIGSHLASLAVEELPAYNVLLREVDLVRMGESYLEQDRFRDAETIADDRRVSLEAREELLGKVALEYLQTGALEEAERLATLDWLTKETSQSLLNEIGQSYLIQGNLEKAEALWRSTNNQEQLRGPLLEAYKQGGNSRKIAELFARSN